MAATRATAPLFLSARTACSSCVRGAAASSPRWSSTSTASETPASPLLSKIKNDLKAAMRAKDTARLTVLRGTISEINQAASSSAPVKTDMQVLALLRKRKAASENAKKEAEAANRADLAEKQDKEIEVIEQLVGSVKMVESQALRDIVRGKIEALRDSSHGGELKQGAVMKELLKPGGELDGKVYEGKVLAEVVREELATNPKPS
ncbi:hypothetical protein G647_09608 [Cladophialophora carrionii CBS 160.54]|uniref:Altered inheritance of mitochondria protein 41 n=1 Tax=Cladophialophora carrionii CBS 160.54 TaxID=1279043 RepID=V9DM71_9EURO|nr:uncharacterized protein G647_09608 [Cladophialophora carrionii CBS 160.54]ETI27418.1 hypothetical protein G647_09608 [Cladophialophora carrionii CBS 160.54]